MSTTAAQDEFNDLIAKQADRTTKHPEDRNDLDLKNEESLTEEDTYRNAQIDAAMRAPSNGRVALKLPPASFDQGRATGVKGVIADARSYETARRTKWKSRVQAARQSIFGLDGQRPAGRARSSTTDSEEERASGSDQDEDTFISQWRESRRRELELDISKEVRSRRTSPSMREYGRMEEVDALGYLDAIEKVGRETTVVIFVYDHECEVSAETEAALRPLVAENRLVRFAKVHYDDIEFDPAAVPSLLAYRNQGELFANLTGMIELIPEEETFTTDALKKLLHQHKVL